MKPVTVHPVTMNPLTLLIQGRDARRYLHGRLTQDVRSMALSEVRRSLLLTPQGRVQGKLDIICAGDNEFILRSDSLPSDSAKQDLTAAILQFKVADDIILTELSPSSASEIIRLVTGEPTIGRELTEKTMATDIDVAGYVSFNKGCYTGQEPVEMSTARGRPNRALVHFYIEGEAALSPEAKIEPNGSVTSSLFVAQLKRTFGLGFVKYDQRDEQSFDIAGYCAIRIPHPQ